MANYQTRRGLPFLGLTVGMLENVPDNLLELCDADRRNELACKNLFVLRVGSFVQGDAFRMIWYNYNFGRIDRMGDTADGIDRGSDPDNFVL